MPGHGAVQSTYVGANWPQLFHPELAWMLPSLVPFIGVTTGGGAGDGGGVGAGGVAGVGVGADVVTGGVTVAVGVER